jgi:YVTN family beta-propeller protein
MRLFLMTVRNCLLLNLSILLSLPLSASTARIYITNSAGDSVEVIDPATNKVVQEIQGIEVPHGVTFAPDGSRVYVSNESENVLDVVDRRTGNIIKKVPLSGHPNNVAVTQDGARVLVAIAQAPGVLDIIDAGSLEREKSIPMKGRLHNVYVTPDGKYAIAGSVAAKFLTVIDLKTEQPVWTVDFDKGVRPIAFETAPDHSTTRLFVQLSDLHGFAVVDFAKRAEVARIKLPDEPTGGVPEQGAPSHGIGVSPDGKTLWVNSSPARSVFVYSLPDLKLMGHVLTGMVPDWLTFTPDSQWIYISNAGSNSVSAIDVKTLKEMARIPVGEVPKRNATLVLP